MATVEIARHEWEDGQRRLNELPDARTRERVHAQVDALLDELRRRVGATYTLAQLADAYADADRWAREAVADRAPAPGWQRTVVLAQAAAFHAYARGAVDYEP